MRQVFTLTVLLLAIAASPALARPGDVDRGFARGGAGVEFGADSSEAWAVALDQFGRPVVGGSEAGGRLLVMRLRSNGRRDPRFGRNGLTTVTLPGLAPGGVRGLDVFRDGRIVLAATLESPDGAAPSRIAVARLLPDGELDPGFGEDGIAVVGPDGAHASALALTHDGVVLVGGGVPVADGDAPLVLRLAPDGTPDDTFDGDGAWNAGATTLRGWARAVLPAADGSVTFAVGAAPGGVFASALVAARLTPAGALDATFGGGDGISEAVLGVAPARDGGATGIVSGPGGRVVLAGTVTGRGSRAEGAVVRMLPDGSIDPAFGRAGAVRLTARARTARRRARAGARRAPGGRRAQREPERGRRAPARQRPARQGLRQQRRRRARDRPAARRTAHLLGRQRPRDPARRRRADRRHGGGRQRAAGPAHRPALPRARAAARLEPRFRQGAVVTLWPREVSSPRDRRGAARVRIRWTQERSYSSARCFSRS